MYRSFFQLNFVGRVKVCKKHCVSSNKKLYPKIVSFNQINKWTVLPLNSNRNLNNSKTVKLLQNQSSSLFSTSCLLNIINNSGSDSSIENEDDFEDKTYYELVKRTLKLPDTGHQVFVIQPYIKWGRFKKFNTNPDLQLDEAVALINSLPKWKVVSTKLISLLSFRSVKVFGKGNLKMLEERISMDKNITAVFISINMLDPEQQRTLEELFKVPVFDRYTIVVQIFKLHAKTREAKIQVAISEIPYLWSRLRHDHEEISDKMGGGATVGGPGESYIEIKRRLLQDKERKLKSKLKKLETQREILRSKRKNLQLPTVAVVGYTNAGKTSLIKALTKEETLQPRNVLFATLDVTVHAGFLPSGLKVLYIDTVGFLADIPTGLIQSFVVTLEDAVQADLIIHVQDVSHPDLKAQTDHVLDTLRSIRTPENLLQTMITVANKVDLLPHLSPELGLSLPVSATSGYGLSTLKAKVEEAIVKATGQMFIKFRVPNGGPEYYWLSREGTVVNSRADEMDNQFLFVDTLITEVNLNRFKHTFILSKVKGRKG